jgi:hypothetical protein
MRQIKPSRGGAAGCLSPPSHRRCHMRCQVNLVARRWRRPPSSSAWSTMATSALTAPCRSCGGWRRPGSGDPRRRWPVVVAAVVQAGLLWAQMGSGRPHPDLPSRHCPGSDDVSRSPWALPLHGGIRGFGLRQGGGGHLLCRRWLTGVLWLDCRMS